MTTDFPQSKQEAINFLKAHQPMPPTALDDHTTRDDLCDNDLMKKYGKVFDYLMKNPTIEAVPLFLNSFGNGDGYGNYQLVEDYLLLFPERDVVPHIKDALNSPYADIRLWAAQFSWSYTFDKDIREYLVELLSDKNREVRYWAFSSLSFLFNITDELRPVLISHYHNETNLSLKKDYEEALNLNAGH